MTTDFRSYRNGLLYYSKDMGLANFFTTFHKDKIDQSPGIVAEGQMLYEDDLVKLSGMFVNGLGKPSEMPVLRVRFGFGRFYLQSPESKQPIDILAHVQRMEKVGDMYSDSELWEGGE